MKTMEIIDAIKTIEKSTARQWSVEFWSDGSCRAARFLTRSYTDYDYICDFSSPDEFLKKIDKIIVDSEK